MSTIFFEGNFTVSLHTVSGTSLGNGGPNFMVDGGVAAARILLQLATFEMGLGSCVVVVVVVVTMVPAGAGATGRIMVAPRILRMAELLVLPITGGIRGVRGKRIPGLTVTCRPVRGRPGRTPGTVASCTVAGMGNANGLGPLLK